MSKGQIFISYRREDSGGYTRAIYDQLVKRFSKERVFMDVDAIEPGLAFDEVIEQAVGHCEVLLVMIGKRWMESEGDAGSRLNDPKDFVRVEIVAALSRNIRVIPILLDGAIMPSGTALPEPLRALTKRNAIDISNSRFDSDVERLVEAVAKALDQPDSTRLRKLVSGRRSLMYWIFGALGGGAIVQLVRFVSSRAPDGRQQSDLVQTDWRFCGKCQSMFYDGYDSKGVCPAGGAHNAMGNNFALPHDVPGPGQRDWRFCQKCQGMFFDGKASKGVCPAGGAHTGAGFNFVLPHDTRGRGQPDWRYCQKCQCIFFDGYPTKGTCAAGGAHIAAGYNFVLPYI
jgi:hypothetical protein